MSRLGGVRGQPTGDSGRFPERVSGIWSPRGILGLEVPSVQGAPPPRRVSPACAPGTVGVEILNPAWATQVTGNAWAASRSRAFFFCDEFSLPIALIIPIVQCLFVGTKFDYLPGVASFMDRIK